jgi:hypothetical protein
MGRVKWLMVVGAGLVVPLFLGVKPGLCAVNCTDIPGMTSDPSLTGPLKAKLKPAAAGYESSTDRRYETN